MTDELDFRSTPDPYAGYQDELPTDLEIAEQVAAKWHDDNIDEPDHDHSSCWCCCITCEHTNPHFDAGCAAIVADRPGRATETGGGPDA